MGCSASTGSAGTPPTGSDAAFSSHSTPSTSSNANFSTRVQIELDGVWRDYSHDEGRVIIENRDRGCEAFNLQARGASYLISLKGPEGEDAPTQKNLGTGTVRNLRFVDAAATGEVFSQDPAFVMGQVNLGAQSKRGHASQYVFKAFAGNEHALECFNILLATEEKMCGEWAAFYHSYSFAALIYEVHAAVGSVLFRFRSQYGTLPRIIMHDFKDTSDAAALIQRFYEDDSKSHSMDHHPQFRKVAISAVCSLASTGPEACPATEFLEGYSCKDVAFKNVLGKLLTTCYVPKSKASKLAQDIIRLSETHGLDVSQFGGEPCKSGKSGHLLQIFVKRSLVDKLTYASLPFGYTDARRMPMADYMNKDSDFSWGQARLLCHPKYFMQANCVRMNVASADPTFHHNRQKFQSDLVEMLGGVLGEANLRKKAAKRIYGDALPSWWSSVDQRTYGVCCEP